MKRVVFLCILVLCTIKIHAQEAYISNYSNREYPLSAYDSVMLSNLPELKAKPVLKTSELPAIVDNSRLPFLRPIYEQIHSECGQVSGIAYNFTYEMNRLRDLPSDTSINQYPTHFTYNFLCTNGYYGVSYIHCFEILRTLGVPTVATYGGMAAGGAGRWMSGYDDYYSAMNNRIREMYQIKVGTEEGLNTLKQWIHNHLDGSEYGGVASFYSNAPWNLRTLKEGTPDEGKHVIVYWNGDPTHAMLICGYNDSIRWDYNEDGQFTNHLDINNDGIVDMKDWEIGGLLFADGYAGGINFADSGKCYMMYKTLAEKVYEGGIWNHSVHILEVKDHENPLLTAKINLSHNSRKSIRIRCGVSTDTADTRPEFVMDMPIFNFQGGSQYMQGSLSPEENKSIEFGLDISPLLGHLKTDKTARIFLEVTERDPVQIGQGMITGFSVIDYTAEPIETKWEGDTLPITDNDVTIVSLLYTPKAKTVKISNDALPTAVVGQNYVYQMSCIFGTSPYRWELLNAHHETACEYDLDTGSVYLEPENWDYASICYPLAFEFPFYGEVYDTIYIHPDGFIMFENTQDPWPYQWDGQLFIRKNKCIAPFACPKLEMIPAFGDGIFVTEEAGQLKIRWVGDVDSWYYSADAEFGLNINMDGDISFMYGKEIESTRFFWSCGVSDGSGQNYYYPALGDKAVVQAGEAVSIVIQEKPEGIHLTEGGMLNGIPTEYHNHLDLMFRVTDDNDISAYRAYEFSSTDLGTDDHHGTGMKNLVKTYPNPFRQYINIQFPGSLKGPLTCKVYNTQGMVVAVLADERDISYPYLLKWDASDAAGDHLSGGMYFIHWQAGDQQHLEKVLYSGGHP